MKIAIIGSGAMGSLMGAKLSNYTEVLLFDHWKDHVNEINENGLTIETNNKKEVIKNIKATNNYNDLMDYDVYIILVKGINTLNEMKKVYKFINEEKLVVTLQNGLGNHYIINNYINEKNISYGMMDFSARLKKPGKIEYQMADSKIAISMFNRNYNNENKLFQTFVKTLEKSKFNVIVDNALEEIWKKLIINCNFNAASGITGLNIGELISDENYINLLKGITKEIVEVANKLNINLNYEEEVNNLFERAKSAKNHYPSLAQDVARKNMTEIDFLNGAIVTEAKKLKIEVPINKSIYDLIKIIENNYNKGKVFNI